MNIEEAIKKLDAFNEYEDNVVLLDKTLYEIQEAIETVLADRERLVEENKELKQRLEDIELQILEEDK